MNETPDTLIKAGSDPEIHELLREYKRATGLGNGYSRLQTQDGVRYQRWAGQSIDGRKHDENSPDGKQVRPWDNSADTRVPTCDEVINERVDLMVLSLNRAEIKVKPVRSRDMASAAGWEKVLNWFIFSKMRPQLADEIDLSAQFQEHYGWCLSQVAWVREVGLREQRISLEQLLQVAQQDDKFALLPLMIGDPQHDEESANLLRELYRVHARETAGLDDEEIPDITDKALRDALKDLRDDGDAEVPVPYLCRDEPMVATLKPWVEVVVPYDTNDLQSARSLFRREFLSESQVRARGAAEGWDKEWIEKACSKQGQASAWQLDIAGAMSREIADGIQLLNLPGTQLIEIVWGYVRKVDPRGVQSVYLTVFHGGIDDCVAKHERLNYRHGQYPFVAFRQEYLGRALVESRGVPDIAATWQNEEKMLRDGLLNRSEWNTLPPIAVPKLGSTNFRFGPSAVFQKSTLTGGVPEMLPALAGSNREALEMIGLNNNRVARYFGLMHETVPPQVSQMKSLKKVQKFAASWATVYQMVLDLIRQYGDRQALEELAGQPLDWDSPAEYKVSVRADPRDLDGEFANERIAKMMDMVVANDTTGTIDRAKLTERAARMIDGELAESILMDQGSASAKLLDDVTKDIVAMRQGVEPRYVKNDPTAQAKLQFMMQIIQGNPEYQKALMSPEDSGDQRFRALMENYAKNLRQSAMQMGQNKITGQTGVKPIGAGQ